MKIFVTGTTGFIGIPLMRALAARGNEVVPFRGDVRNATAVVKAMRGCEAVFHLAGRISYRACDRPLVRAVNVQGTVNVLEAARALGIRRMVHTSSIVTVGVSWDPGQVLDEDAVFNAARLRLEYFDSKREAENRVMEAAARGLDVVIVNPGVVVGEPGDCGRPGPVNKSVRTLAHLPFTLPGGNSWVDVRDVVAGHLLAFEKGRSGRRYILAHENISNADVRRRFAVETGGSLPFIHLPARVLRACARMTGSQVAMRIGGFFMYYDCSRARKELGWNPRPAWPAIKAMALSG